LHILSVVIGYRALLKLVTDASLVLYNLMSNFLTNDKQYYLRSYVSIVVGPDLSGRSLMLVLDSVAK
jgi:hypothetical protein